MVQSEIFDGSKAQFTILDQRLSAMKLRRNKDGSWSIEVLIDIDAQLNDGSERTISTGKRLIRVAGRQEGSRARKKTGSKKEEK